MTIVLDWPEDWYKVVTASFYLQSRSQVAESPWSGRRSAYGPHAQLWTSKLTMVPLQTYSSPKVWEVSSFFSRLDGQAGLLRMGAPARRRPQYNNDVVISSTGFSDSTLFSDGTGFVESMLPPTAFVAVAASRGDRFLQIGGLLVSISRILRRGDLLEIRPGGVSSLTPHLYEVVVDGSTNSSGVVGVEIRPRLRAGVAVGDQVVLTNPTTVFRVVDDNQGEIQVVAGGESPNDYAAASVLGSLGFSLIEAIN